MVGGFLEEVTCKATGRAVPGDWDYSPPATSLVRGPQDVARGSSFPDNPSTCAPKPRSPPWQQKIFSSTMAAMGRQLKQSVKVFHSLML